MTLKHALWAGLITCLALPAWATPLVNETGTPASSQLHDTPTRQVGEVALCNFVARIWSENPGLQAVQAAVEAARARADGADRPLHNPALGLMPMLLATVVVGGLFSSTLLTLFVLPVLYGLFSRGKVNG